jgi:phenylpyruvate tautomerase
VDNSDTLKALSQAVASSVGKPERVSGSAGCRPHRRITTRPRARLLTGSRPRGPQWVMCSLTTDKPMIYSGTEEPAAYGELISIGAIGGEKNQAVRPALPLLG